MATLSRQAANSRVGQYTPDSIAGRGASHAGGVRRRDESPEQFRGRMDGLKAASGQPSQTYGDQNFRAPGATRQDRIIAARMDGTFDTKRNTFNAGNTNVQMDESGNIAPRAIAPASPPLTSNISPPPPQSPNPPVSQTPPPSVVNNSPIGPVNGDGNPLPPLGGKMPAVTPPVQNSPIGPTSPADPAAGLYNQRTNSTQQTVTPVTPPVTPKVTPQSVTPSVTPRSPVTPKSPQGTVDFASVMPGLSPTPDNIAWAEKTLGVKISPPPHAVTSPKPSGARLGATKPRAVMPPSFALGR